MDIESAFGPASNFKTIGQLVSTLAPKIVLLAGIILFVLIIGIGFTIIQNAGTENAQAMQKGKNAITYALVGFALIFTAFWIVQFVNKIMGNPFGGIF